MLAKLIDSIDKLIVERGSAVVLRERVALLREQLVLLERDKENALAKVAELQQRLAQAQGESARHAASQQFVEGRGGALFKRRSQGGYMEAVYCPLCHRPTSTFPDDSESYCCDACRWFSTFSGNELRSVLAELPA